MAEANVLEELRALEVRRAAAALAAGEEERRVEILAGLEGEARRLKRDLAGAAARLRLIAEFLPPEVAERALAAAVAAAAPLAPEAEPAGAELAAPLPLPPAALGEYDADLPPGPAAHLAPLPDPAAPLWLPPSPLAALLTPEAALPPPLLDPLPPDAPADGEPSAPLAAEELPGAPPDAEPSALASPAADADLGFDLSAEPRTTEELLPFDALAVQALAAAESQGIPEPEVDEPDLEVVEAFDEDGAEAAWAALEVAPQPARPAPAPATMVVPGEHRVVVHVVDGPVKRGVLLDPDLFAPELALAPTPGAAAEPLEGARVKAIFFMAAPGALPPAPERQRLKVTFHDSRQLAGSSGDYTEGCAGFFLVPADWRSAAARIWIYADAVKEVAIGV